MHGLWYQRTWLDLGREAAIHAVLSLLYVPAYKIRCATSMAIVTLIGLQHLASLFVHPDGFLPPSVVLPGAALLGILGYMRGSQLLFFVGLYSVVSKFEFIRLLSYETRASMASFADPLNEIMKLATLLVLWFAFAYIWTFVYIERAVCSFFGWRIPPRRPREWFSEVTWICPGSRSGWRHLSGQDQDPDEDFQAGSSNQDIELALHPAGQN